MHRHLVDLLKHQRAFEQVIRLKRPPLRRRALPRPKEPNHIRLAYYGSLRNLVLLPAKRLVQSRLVSALPSIVSAAGIARARGTRRDADPGDVDGIVAGISDDFFDQVHVGRMEDVAEQYAAATSSFQKAQLAGQLRAAVGVEVPIADRELRKRVETFTATNVALIKSIPQRYFQQVQTTVMNDVSAGKRWEEIADDLEDRYEVSESTAQLIARDQVGKFFGSLNQVRQQDLGIQRFVWQTMNDTRVRDSHKDLQGESFSWDDPPQNDDGEDITPGSEINCRCWADPDVQSVVEELEAA